MEKISPTRMNLLSRKSQIALAREGVQLLKFKREVFAVPVHGTCQTSHGETESIA